jgi:hypothetical protein
VTSGSPTPTTATSGLEDPRQGAGANEATEARTDDLRAERDALADLIDPVDRTNPQGRRAGLSPLADAYSAADRILGAGFRRVPEDAPVRKSGRCPSTLVYPLGFGRGKRSVQCKHSAGHDGQHAALGELGMGDCLWLSVSGGGEQP